MKSRSPYKHLRKLIPPPPQRHVNKKRRAQSRKRIKKELGSLTN